jgi:hypothetical protein
MKKGIIRVIAEDSARYTFPTAIVVLEGDTVPVKLSYKGKRRPVVGDYVEGGYIYTTT